MDEAPGQIAGGFVMSMDRGVKRWKAVPPDGATRWTCCRSARDGLRLVTPPPEGTPWWAWVLVALGVVAIPALVTAITTIALQRSTKPQLADIATNARTAAEQTANAHHEADYPNLREDLDAKFEVVNNRFDLMSQKFDDMTEELAGLHDEDAELGTTLSTQRLTTVKAIAGIRRQFDQYVDAMPLLIQQEIGTHCAIRNSQK